MCIQSPAIAACNPRSNKKTITIAVQKNLNMAQTPATKHTSHQSAYIGPSFSVSVGPIHNKIEAHVRLVVVRQLLYSKLVGPKKNTGPPLHHVLCLVHSNTISAKKKKKKKFKMSLNTRCSGMKIEKLIHK